MKGNCMSLDCKWLVCSPRGGRKGEVWSGLKISHQHSKGTLVTGCHHHQTDPQNLRKENKKKRKVFITVTQRNNDRLYISVSNVSARQVFAS